MSCYRTSALPPGTGDFIAYSCKERKNVWYAVCVMKVDGSEKRRLTDRLTTTDPAWSPDGRQIAFTRNEDVGESTTFTDDDVFVMDADGGNVRQLTPEVDGSSSNQPAWSPDGRRIVYVRGPSIASAVVAVTPLAFGELLVVDADGGEPTRLTRAEPDAAPAWSPDGREVVFVRGHDLNKPSGDMDLFIVDAAGGTPRRLTRTPRSLETAPVWSPDGSRIAFARSSSFSAYTGKAAIFVINRDGSGESLVARAQALLRDVLRAQLEPGRADHCVRDGRTGLHGRCDGSDCDRTPTSPDLLHRTVPRVRRAIVAAPGRREGMSAALRATALRWRSASRWKQAARSKPA